MAKNEIRRDAIKGAALRAIDDLISQVVRERSTGRQVIEIEINTSQGAIGPAHVRKKTSEAV